MIDYTKINLNEYKTTNPGPIQFEVYKVGSGSKTTFTSERTK